MGEGAVRYFNHTKENSTVVSDGTARHGSVIGKTILGETILRITQQPIWEQRFPIEQRVRFSRGWCQNQN
jgi:hypothetical protein